MSRYDDISQSIGNVGFERKMYDLLNSEEYRKMPYQTVDLGEEMSAINQNIYGWWKMRYLLDHRTRCAYEFMDESKKLVTVTDENIAWTTLRKLPEEIVTFAKRHSGIFPTFIRGGYKDGLAMVEWQINPDGSYYMDDDGFGMSDDERVSLYGIIDRTGKVVHKFRYFSKRPIPDGNYWP